MDLRQLKIALTVDLMNLPHSRDVITLAKNKMVEYSAETGHLIEISELSRTQLKDQLESKTCSLQFEKCVLNLELIGDQFNGEEYLQNFDLFETLHN